MLRSFGRLTAIATVILSMVVFDTADTVLAEEPGELSLDDVKEIVKREVDLEFKRRGVGGSSGGSSLCIREGKTYSEGAKVGDQECRNGVWHN